MSADGFFPEYNDVYMTPDMDFPIEPVTPEQQRHQQLVQERMQGRNVEMLQGHNKHHVESKILGQVEETEDESVPPHALKMILENEE